MNRLGGKWVIVCKAVEICGTSYTHFWRLLAGFLQVMKQLLEPHFIREMKIEPG